jgi:acetate kinase
MKILVLNPGSSTLKWQLIDTTTQPFTTLQEHTLEATDSHILFHIHDLLEYGPAVDAIACRVVHGGDRFTQAVRVTPEVRQAIRDLGRLAPLHNPIAADVLEELSKLVSSVPCYAVFDTAFHTTMPRVASSEAIPQALAMEQGLRRYGMHGISYQHLVRRMGQLAPSARRLIACHLGNGSSISAIHEGTCVDTSMGLTPLPGLIMGTRCGDIGADVVLHLLRQSNRTPEQVEHLLTRESGLKGLAGTSDMRELLARDDADAQFAIEAYTYRLRKYIGAYAAVLGGVDAVVFTGGIGEHAAAVRAKVCEPLAWLGLHLDTARNGAPSTDDRPLHAEGSPVGIWVILADEAKEMARQVLALQQTAS